MSTPNRASDAGPDTNTGRKPLDGWQEEIWLAQDRLKDVARNHDDPVEEQRRRLAAIADAVDHLREAQRLIRGKSWISPWMLTGGRK